MRQELPRGQWADLLDVGDLRSGDRKALNRALRVEVDPESKTQVMPGDWQDRINDAVLERIVQNWSLPLPLPSDDLASLNKLDLDVEKALIDAIKPYVDLLQGREDPTRKDTDPTEG